MKKKFGELLLERKMITPEQLAAALSLQRQRGLRLGAALVVGGHITETQLVDVLGDVLGAKVVDLQGVVAGNDVLRLVPHRFCLDHEVFPFALRRERGKRILSVAMSDPLNYRIIDELSFMTDAQIEPHLARATHIELAIARHYGRTAPLKSRRHVSGLDLSPGQEQGAGPSTMAIVRWGGLEEVVDTTTGKVISPFFQGDNEQGERASPPTGQSTPRAEGQDGAMPAAHLDAPTLRLRPPSAILLTDEVIESSVPVPAVSAGPPIGAGTPLIPVMPVSPAPPTITGTPMAQGPRPVIVAGSPYPPANGAAISVPVPPPSGAPGNAPGGRLAAPTIVEAAGVGAAFDDALGALIDAQGGAVDAEAFVRLEQKFWALMRILARKGVLTPDEFRRELDGSAETAEQRRPS